MDVGGSGGGGGRGGAAALALLGSHQGRAADGLARAARLQPRAAGGGQRHLLCLDRVGVGLLTWWLAGDGAGRGRGSGACFALLASGSGRRRIGLPCALAAQGGGKGGTVALAGGGPGVAAL